jgi:hypothetical protein
MFIASWQFDMKYGTREEATRLMKELNASMPASGWKAKRTRTLMGSIGAPESRMVFEHEFASLADLEASWDALHKNGEQFRKMVSQMKGFIVDGTPRWEIYRVIDG